MYKRRLALPASSLVKERSSIFATRFMSSAVAASVFDGSTDVDELATVAAAFAFAVGVFFFFVPRMPSSIALSKSVEIRNFLTWTTASFVQPTMLTPPSARLSVRPTVRPTVHPPDCPCARPSVRPPVRPSIRLTNLATFEHVNRAGHYSSSHLAQSSRMRSSCPGRRK